MNRSNRIKVALLALAVALSVSACAASGGSKTMPATTAETNQIVMASSAAAAEDAVTSQEAGSETANTTMPAGRKMIRRVSLQLETKSFDGLTTSLTQRIAELGGYVEESEVAGRSDSPSGRSAYYVVRIPQEQVDAFVTAVGEEANVINKQESAEDVTLQYVDVESRKKALKIEQDRLLELLEKAGQLENIIALEQRLSEVRYELERYESQLRTYDNQIQYSTVTLHINEVERITPAAEKSVATRMGSGLSRSIYDIGKGLQELAVFAVVNLPYLLLFAAFVLLVFLVVRRLIFGNRGSKKKGPNPPPTPKP